MKCARLVVLPLLLTATGCSAVDGSGFARLSARLWTGFAALDPAAGRLQPDGWLRTSDGFELKLGSLSLGVTGARLLGTTAPPWPEEAAHDAAAHDDDAAADDAAAPGPLARLPVGAALELLGEGTRRELSACEPSCELPGGEAGSVELALDRLCLQGTLRDTGDRLGGATLQVTADLAAPLVLPLKLPATEPLDREHPYHFELSVFFWASEGLLDGVAWDRLDHGGGKVVLDLYQNRAAGAALVAALRGSRASVSTARSK